MTKSLRFHLQRLLTSGILRGLGLTPRITRINWHVLETLRREGRPHIACLWHNNLMFFGTVLRHRGYAAMISRSKDGDMIADVLARLGFLPVRGSSSAGGAMALREMFRHLRQGRDTIFTPDGPRGPRYVLQAGPVALAARMGVPLVPMAFSAPHCWELSSWDRMKLPKPFSPVTVILGDPMNIDPDPDKLETEQARVEQALRLLLVRAERFTGGTLIAREPLLAQAAQTAGLSDVPTAG